MGAMGSELDEGGRNSRPLHDDGVGAEVHHRQRLVLLVISSRALLLATAEEGIDRCWRLALARNGSLHLGLCGGRLDDRGSSNGNGDDTLESLERDGVHLDTAEEVEEDRLELDEGGVRVPERLVRGGRGEVEEGNGTGRSLDGL